MSKFCEHKLFRLQTSQHLVRPLFQWEKHPSANSYYLAQQIFPFSDVTRSSNVIHFGFNHHCLAPHPSVLPFMLFPLRKALFLTTCIFVGHFNVMAIPSFNLSLGGANFQEIYFWVLDARGLEAASGPWGGLVGGGGVGKDPAPGWTTILLSVSRERGCQPHHTTAPVEAEQGRRRKKGELRQTEARRRAKVWRRGWVDFGEVGQGDGRSLQSPPFARSRWDKYTWAFPLAWSSNMCDGLP